eukprot:jgi/Chrzof1/6521/UNPLg00871.t1
MDYMSRYKANNIYTCLVTRRSSCAELTTVDTVDNGCKPQANSRTSAFPQSAPKFTQFTQFAQFILGCWMYTMPCAVAQVVSLAWTTFTGRVM